MAVIVTGAHCISCRLYPAHRMIRCACACILQASKQAGRGEKLLGVGERMCVCTWTGKLCDL